MLKNYLKSAFRNMLKYKGFSTINILGLTIGIAVCFLLSLWIKDELSYDRFHTDADQIYRFRWEGKFGDNSWDTPMTPLPLGNAIRGQFPEVDKITQFTPTTFTLQKGEDFIREGGVYLVDEYFFDVLTIDVLAGDITSMLDNPDGILLTDEMAAKYFEGQADYEAILGQTLSTGNDRLLQVVGIFKKLPTQSHMEINFISPIDFDVYPEWRRTSWGSGTLFTYFKLNESNTPDQLSNKLNTYVAENVIDDGFSKEGNYTRFPFDAITDIHLEGRRTNVLIFSIIAVFILLLACINFVNLSTARAITRAREVGVRKVLGSSRQQLIQQFFSESTVYVLLAVILGVALASVTLPYFNELTGKNLEIDLLNSPFIWVFMSVLIVVTAFLTGAIPAFVLSSFLPTKVMKGQLIGSGGKNRFRQSLVVTQFCISSVLIIGTLVVKDQLSYLQEQPLGFDKEQVLLVERARSLGDNFDLFMDRMEELPFTNAVSAAHYMPGGYFDSSTFELEQPANYEETSLTYNVVDVNFIESLSLEVIAGRNFDANLASDSSGYILNEKAVEKLGWQDPIGKTMNGWNTDAGRVIGVVKNFNFSSLHDPIDPIVLFMHPMNLRNIIIKLNPGTTQEQISQIQKEWKTLAPAAPFEFSFLDENIQALYEEERQMSISLTLFSSLAIFIACLGLFGLAAFIAEKRTKEIGIRKVLGATVGSIVSLLSVDFLKLVFIALILAIPIAWYFMHQWLDNFAYRVNISWWIYVIAGITALLIAFVTISFQSIRVATSNPVKALRNE
ncbi:MAG: ABC transporter permease [Bacteroidota bacterium]